MKYRLIIVPLLLTISIFFTKTEITKTTHKPNKITTIIFNLDAVIFLHNKTAFAHQVGLGKITKYTLTSWSNPETTCLNTLATISSQETQQPVTPFFHRDKKMPNCIVDWLLGKKTHIQVRNELKNQLHILEQKNYFRNKQEKELVERILKVSIHPKYIVHFVKPVPAMVDFVKELKARGYKVLALSNLAKEQYDRMCATYPDITQLFNDIIVSSHANMIKPNKKLFEHVLQTHNLTAKECITIEPHREYIESAQKIGLVGILHKNVRSTRAALERLGV